MLVVRRARIQNRYPYTNLFSFDSMFPPSAKASAEGWLHLFSLLSWSLYIFKLRHFGFSVGKLKLLFITVYLINVMLCVCNIEADLSFCQILLFFSKRNVDISAINLSSSNLFILLNMMNFIWKIAPLFSLS